MLHDTSLCGMGGAGGVVILYGGVEEVHPFLASKRHPPPLPPTQKHGLVVLRVVEGVVEGEGGGVM